MIDLAKRRIAVTGGAGFLGGFLAEDLARRGCQEVFIPRHSDFDLTVAADVERFLAAARPDMLFHLAALVGGIGANKANPGRFFYDNAIMGIQLIEYARRFGVKKTVIAGTICSYPAHTPVPFREESLWDGYPEETNAPYGIAKKALLVQAQAYRQQYGMNIVFLMPVNLYGPRDNFDPSSSHVIPALIRKCMAAKKQNAPEIVCWGDGSPTREFLYVEDAAEAFALAAERYDGGEPVNLGSGQEISIRDLAHFVAGACGYEGKIVWDTTKPNGQPRRSLDTSRAERYFGWRATTRLAEGLARTVAWYNETQPDDINSGIRRNSLPGNAVPQI